MMISEMFKKLARILITLTAVLGLSSVIIAQAEKPAEATPETAAQQVEGNAATVDEPTISKTVPAAELSAPRIPDPALTVGKTVPTDFSTKLLAPSKKQTSADESDWQVAFSPYFYMTGLSGRIGARGRVAEIDADFIDVIKKFKMGIMGTLDVKKGRFVVLTDIMWLKLDEENETPGDLYSSSQVGVNLFTFDTEAGYRVYESEKGSFDVLGGFRMMSVETNVNFRTGILPGFDVSERKTWATPVFGVRGLVNVTPKIFLSTKFDIGGGLGADFTDQLYIGGGYKLTKNIALVGGWRYMKTDYDDSEGFLFDTAMNGTVIGAKFSF